MVVDRERDAVCEGLGSLDRDSEGVFEAVLLFVAELVGVWDDVSDFVVVLDAELVAVCE